MENENQERKKERKTLKLTFLVGFDQGFTEFGCA